MPIDVLGELFIVLMVKPFTKFVCGRPSKRSPNGDMKFGKILQFGNELVVWY